MEKIESLMLFLVLLFLPTQLGKHFWPQFAYLFSLKIDYLSPTIYFWDILVVGLLAIFLLQGHKVNRQALNLVLVFLLLLSLSLFQIVFGTPVNLGAGVFRMEQYLAASLLGIYLASKRIEEFRGVLFYSLASAVFLQSSIALLEFINGSSIGLWVLGERSFTLSTPAIAKFDFYGREFLRPYATLPHPNVLAAFLLIGLMLLMLIKPVSYLAKRLLEGATLLGGLTVILTASRVAILAGLLLGLVFLKRTGLAILILSLVILSPFIFTRFTSLLSFDNLSLLRREELIEISLIKFTQKPLLGVGLNNFIYSGADSLLVGPNRFLQPVHNIYLLSLVEVGVVGTLGLFIFCAIPIWGLWKRKSLKEAKILLTVWVLIAFLGMFDHYFLTLPQGYRMLMLVWGLSYSVLEFKDGQIA